MLKINFLLIIFCFILTKIINKFIINIPPVGILRGEFDLNELCNCQRVKHRSEEEYKNLINRLNRIEGLIRGIKKMVDSSAYCTDIITQVAAVTAALNAFNKELLGVHIKTCVAEDIKMGKNETADELVLLLQRLMK